MSCPWLYPHKLEFTNTAIPNPTAQVGSALCVKVRPKCRPVGFSPSRSGFGVMRKRLMTTKHSQPISNIPPSPRRLACIAMMLDESKIEVNPQQREGIEREVIALWQACL